MKHQAAVRYEQVPTGVGSGEESSRQRSRSFTLPCWGLLATAAATTTAVVGGYSLYAHRSSGSTFFAPSDSSSLHPDTTADPCQVGTWSPPGLASFADIKEENTPFYGDVGVLYSVSGPPSYAQKEFLPLLRYLKDGLGIPDAAERERIRTYMQSSSVQRHGRGAAAARRVHLRNRNSTNSTRSTGIDEASATATQWALVTELHLCNNVLRPILPFFDVVTVIDLNKELLDGRGAKEERHDQRRRILKNSLANNTAASSKIQLEQSVQGQHDLALHRAKAVKVLAISRYAPFRHTIFIDLDMVPCREAFAHSLLDSIAKGPGGQRMAFDVALPYASHPGVNLPMPPANKARHYHRGNSNDNDEEDEEKGGRGSNQHNTACVVLNLTSDATKELLRRYEHDFFNTSLPALPILDQPSFGRALFSMWKQDIPAATEKGGRLERSTPTFTASLNPSLRHVDLDIDIVCRKGSRNDRRRDRGITDLTCGTSNGCLLIHKPSGKMK